MKETGIIMSGDHPKLILDELKTQTRRLAKLHKFNENPNEWRIRTGVNCWFADSIELNKYHIPAQQIYIKCPYGQVGDRLWVRETCYKDTLGDWRYRVDDILLPMTANYIGRDLISSLFMPRWASRITLEITEVRVERLQEITYGDCMKEGLDMSNFDYRPGWDVSKFKNLWDSINAKRGYGWEVNPWVWVINFQVAQ